MENNENEFDKSPSSNTEDGFTKAPEVNQTEGQPQQNGYNSAPQDSYGQPQQNAYGQPSQNAYGQPNGAMYNQQNAYNDLVGQETQGGSQGFAIAGMVLGILSLVCCCTGYIALVAGIVGFVLSLIALIQKRPGKGMAIAGIICSSISIVMLVILLIVGSSVSTSDWDYILKQMQEAADDVQ
mgnify:FL=1